MTHETIWNRQLTPEQVNAFARESMVGHLGIVCTEISADTITATMPVDHTTRQPYGVLHGGASMALSETLASVAGTLAVRDDQMVVGIEINGNHVRQARSGHVVGRARPVHLGGRIQVWQVDIHDDDGSLVCTSRVTLAVLDRKGQGE